MCPWLCQKPFHAVKANLEPGLYSLEKKNEAFKKPCNLTNTVRETMSVLNKEQQHTSGTLPGQSLPYD